MKIAYPDSLPVSQRRKEIVSTIRSNQVVVISGATGSGKTTQIPKMCLEAGLGERKKIGCTQPRRVAALSVAQRLSDELKESHSQIVGSKIRFDDRTSKDTIIQVMTDGILLQEFQLDPKLNKYECLIIDEAHERSLNIDFILGLLRELLPSRKDLKVIITSATIDTQKFSKAFNNAPIIEVSGTLFPVETVYKPVDSESDENEDINYLEACANEAQTLVRDGLGDVLVFLPTEADIRECTKILAGQLGSAIEVVPLFGRLSSKDQVRIFQPGEKNRIILSTNIAETSVTVPRIKSVVDSGLVRLSRYSHTTGTLHLPIEKISRSSANQRKGRCGRLSPGVCVRIYDEDDFEQRDEFTEPEIFRTNLGSVILRLLSLKHYKIEDFPFIDPPNSKIIRASFQQLIALGAIDQKNRMTSIGRDLVKLPIDLSIGRMMIEAEQKGVIQEVAVIGAALCIQDPRERPEIKREQAEQEHRKFTHPDSDFLTLYRIWSTFHDDIESFSLNKLRKFCKKHFLSFMRMREWMDIHRQILSCFGMTKKEVSFDIVEKNYDNVHRSILAGSLLNIGQKITGNTYKATRDREVSIFPGSGLFDKQVMKKLRKMPRHYAKAVQDPDLGNTPAWIVAGSISETSRTFARTVAKIESEWILPLAKHVLRKSYKEAFWSAKSGRVLVMESCRVYGLLVAVNRVGYGSIDAKAAKDIFIRSALVNREISVRIPLLEQNWAVMDKALQDLSISRTSFSWQLDDRIYKFYDKQLPEISSIPELQKWLGDEANRELLRLKITDLMDDSWKPNEKSFPSNLKMGNSNYTIKYNFLPGKEEDGVTLCIDEKALNYLTPELMDWIIPGYLEDQLEYYLRALPKQKRTQLFPLADAKKKVLEKIKPGNYSLIEAIQSAVFETYSVTIEKSDLQTVNIPPQLKPRIELRDQKGKVISVSRDYQFLKKQMEASSKSSSHHDDSLWKEARREHEINDLGTLDSFSFPNTIEVAKAGNIAVFAYPGLKQESSKVSLRLYAEKSAAYKDTREAFSFWFEYSLSKDLAWIQKDLRDVRKRCSLAYAPMGKVENLERDLYAAILTDAKNRYSIYPIDSNRYEKWFADVRKSWKGLVPKLIDQVLLILDRRNEFLLRSDLYPNGLRDLKTLLPTRFALQTPLDQIFHLHRYLKAMEMRTQRWKNNPAKDSQKYARVERYEKYFYDQLRKSEFSAKEANQLKKYFWLLQEFKVSVFAPELKTATKISEKLLEDNML